MLSTLGGLLGTLAGLLCTLAGLLGTLAGLLGTLAGLLGTLAGLLGILAGFLGTLAGLLGTLAGLLAALLGAHLKSEGSAVVEPTPRFASWDIIFLCDLPATKVKGSIKPKVSKGHLNIVFGKIIEKKRSFINNL